MDNKQPKDVIKTAALIISHKKNEKRRALMPEDIAKMPADIRSNIYVEEGYGNILGIDDADYINAGANIVSREEALSKDILVDPKIGDAGYLADLRPGQTIFGWVHAVQNKNITDQIVDNKATAIAWEDMYEDGRHIFWRNNEVAGEAAVMHALAVVGKAPYELKVALLGNGNVARGAYRILVSLGADVTQYNRRCESLFRSEMPQYDVIVNAILWDTKRTDHIIYHADLLKLKKQCLIIDISCDRNGGVETSVPTTMDNPVYEVEGIKHYVVDHTPSIFFLTISSELSGIVSKYLPMIMRNQLDNCLSDAVAIKDGNIVDSRIIDFQKRSNN